MTSDAAWSNESCHEFDGREVGRLVRSTWSPTWTRYATDENSKRLIRSMAMAPKENAREAPYWIFGVWSGQGSFPPLLPLGQN